MVNLKRIMAGIIAGATVVSMASCSNGTTDSTTTSSANSSNNETTIDDEIENPVSVGNISVNAGEDVEPAELQYLGCYDITIAGDVKPSYKKMHDSRFFADSGKADYSYFFR